MTIRPAVASDLDAIQALDGEVFGADAWSALAWQGEWDRVPDTRHLIVAVEAVGVVGFAVLSAVADIADLHRVAVASDRRGHGIGAALVEAVAAEARRRGCERMLLEVEATNGSAIALYERLGFVEIARRDAYYGPGRNALVMQRRLT
ncbi:MAG TPA: ribosomal protein S18-alanine N-acetyltransferase [Nocardioidaceae bacterium]|nr:ribosomal protein S18-alanine N-acetyltransferase [Nocardioidaceae bacterium]